MEQRTDDSEIIVRLVTNTATSVVGRPYDSCRIK
jgi:hypothetical protein